MPPQQDVHQLYRRLDTIGKGAYGSVHKGVNIQTGQVVALKIINLDTEDDDVGDIQREVALLTQLRDAPNVTQYYGCFLDGPRVWIVMEYAEGGSVRTLMKACKDNIIEEKYAVVIIREVLRGLGFLHKSGIIHRDLKAANILITATGKVMICDFGVSALLITTSSKRNTLIGTPHWMAPEVAHGVAYDTKADIWSLGIVIYEMVKGNVPHAQIFDQHKLLQMIPRMKPPRLIEGEGSIPLREFVSSCLRESPKDRLSAEELLKTKLMRSITKTPVSILTDLITRYESWVKEGNTRTSVVGDLAWEEEETAQRELAKLQRESVGWAFDTVRAKSTLSIPSYEELLAAPSSLDDDGASFSTVRPPPSKVPPTLRMLFEDENNDSSLFPVAPPVELPMPSRSRTPRRGRDRSDSVSKGEKEELPTLKSPEFVFPPRSAVEPSQEDEDYEFNFNFDSDSPITPEPTASFGTLDRPRSEEQTAPTLSDPSDPSDTTVPHDSDVTVTPKNVSDATSAALANTPLVRPLNRKRSQSSAGESRPIVKTHRERNLASSVDFHFPSRPSSDLDPDLSPSPSSTPPNFAGPSHHTAASLDTSILPKRLPSPGSLSRPPMAARKASAPVLESSRLAQGIHALDSIPFPRFAVPGLKDVLKIPAVTSEHQLGMSDLLPPSPFLQQTQQPPIPPGGSSSETSSRPWQLNPSASSSTTSLNSISSLQSQLAADSSMTTSNHTRSRSQGFVSSLGISTNPLSGPIIKPLDFAPLTDSHEKTHAHLASTVDDLARWLSVVEVGLTQILDETMKDSIADIAEEQEPDDHQGSGDETISLRGITSTLVSTDSIDIAP